MTLTHEIDRDTYVGEYGPTTGDRIRLGDTNLIVEVERDLAEYGNELVYGWGKNVRAGMMMSHGRPGNSELDIVIPGVLIIDPVLGVMKGDIGIKDGLVTGIGRAGNPDIMDGVDLEIGTNTLVRFGAGLIATAGGVDSHVHLVTPKLIPVAVSSGITTLIGGGLAQNAQFKIHRTFEALERMPVNVGLQGLGSATHPAPMLESLEAGACGFKVHEDTGAYPDVIDTCLKVADAHDVSVALHTDGLQESVHVGETVDAIAGRAVHAYHVEGAGGGHAPDVLELAGVPNIIPSSTTPTIPYTVGAHGEHFAMTALIHAVRRHDQAEAAALDDRLRRETMAAEDVLHDLGAIPIINSDSQGMGRIGEVICRTWQLAHKMKAEAGENGAGHDNERVLQYIAKYTINPAIAHGISDYVGSIAPGKMADIVLWRPEFFGIKPEQVIKGGFTAWGPLGEGNASVGGAEPVAYGPHFGGSGEAAPSLSALFVSEASLSLGLAQRLRTARKLLAVRGVRGVTRDDMIRNRRCPAVRVDAKERLVTVDGEAVTSQAVAEVPLNRRYMLA